MLRHILKKEKKRIYLFLLFFPTFYVFDFPFFKKNIFMFILLLFHWGYHCFHEIVLFCFFYIKNALAYLSDLLYSCDFLFPLHSYLEKIFHVSFKVGLVLYSLYFLLFILYSLYF